MLCDDGKKLTSFYTGKFDTTKVSDEDLGTSLYKLGPSAPYKNRTPFVSFDEHISNLKNDSMPKKINTADHCFGCTAGSGSSCGGILV